MCCGIFQKEDSLTEHNSNLNFASRKLHPQNVHCIGNLFMKKLFANFILRSARARIGFRLISFQRRFRVLLFAVFALQFFVLDCRPLSKQWAELRESCRFRFAISVFGGCEVKTDIFPCFGIEAVTVRLIIDEVCIHFSEEEKFRSLRLATLSK